MSKPVVTAEQAFQRYTDEVAAFTRMLENPSASQNTKFEQALIMQRAWKEFSRIEGLSDEDDPRFAQMIERNDNLADALTDVRACLVAIDYGQLLDHVTIADKHVGLQFDATCRLIVMALKLASDAIEANDQ